MVRHLRVILGLLLLAVPLATSHADLPLNVLSNGGFALGWQDWSVKGTGDLSGPVLVSPGADGTGTAMQTREVGIGSGWVHQDVATTAHLPVSLLDFHARIDRDLANPMGQGIAVVADHNLQTGLAETTVSVGFAGGQGRFVVFCNGFLLPCAPATFTPPTDGQWHHYQAILSAAGGIGILLIDGVQVAAYTNGAPASVSAPERVLFGDLAYHVRGDAPTVSWDDLYYGPTV